MNKLKFPKAAEAMKALSRSDERMKLLIEKVGPIRIELDPQESVFQALARSIVYQQLHGKAAATILARFVSLYSNENVFPRPSQVMDTDLEKLRSSGLSRSKACAILDLAAHALERRIPDRAQAEQMSDAELIDQLSQVKGIGRWTVEMFLIFTLGRTDVWPVHDYGVRKGFALIYGKKTPPKPAELEKTGKRYAPFRSAAAWYFWRALEL